jgi:hypothetical protein
MTASDRFPARASPSKCRRRHLLGSLSGLYDRHPPATLERGMIPEAEAKWPRLTDCLNLTGLGSDPRLIQKLATRAERRPGCR